jgi:hypothetical protein
MIEAVEACVSEEVLGRKAASQFQQCVLDAMKYEPGTDGAAPTTRWLTLGERAARMARTPRA